MDQFENLKMMQFEDLKIWRGFNFIDYSFH